MNEVKSCKVVRTFESVNKNLKFGHSDELLSSTFLRCFYLRCTRLVKTCHKSNLKVSQQTSKSTKACFLDRKAAERVTKSREVVLRALLNGTKDFLESLKLRWFWPISQWAVP